MRAIKAQFAYFLTRSGGKPFAFAGLWEWWRPKDAPAETAGVETFTILTTEPNALCAQIHNRMPLILAPEDFACWLGTPDDRAALLRPFPADDMEMWPVTAAVGNVKNTGPELVEPIGATVEGTANRPITLTVRNLDSTTEEFESRTLRVEKIVAGNSDITLHLPPLVPGRYRFYGDFNKATAQGAIIAE
jgi:hypothetical protein